MDSATSMMTTSRVWWAKTKIKSITWHLQLKCLQCELTGSSKTKLDSLSFKSCSSNSASSCSWQDISWSSFNSFTTSSVKRFNASCYQFMFHTYLLFFWWSSLEKSNETKKRLKVMRKRRNIISKLRLRFRYHVAWLILWTCTISFDRRCHSKKGHFEECGPLSTSSSNVSTLSSPSIFSPNLT